MNLDGIDPLDGRYFDAEISKHLSEKTRIIYQARLEGALASTLADWGICDKSLADEINKAAKNIDIEKVQKEEETTRHDIKAIVNTIKAEISDEAKPYVHFGATSYDIVSNASALQFKDAIQELVLPRLAELIETLTGLADTYKSQPQIGRTHGQHAVPITFGFALSEYVSRLRLSGEALHELSQNLHGKFSGAVGAYNALSIFIDDPIKFERDILKKIGLQPSESSTQIVPAEVMIRLLDELAITSGIMANLAHDMRHLQRTEINEIRERFEEGQTGSSTMAHKRNPWNFENVVSMSKQVLGQIVSANLNISSEHQRDLTDSASARFYPIVLASVASMTKRLNNIMGKIEVDEQSMQKNLEMTAGAIAAEPLYLLFEKYGHTLAHEKAKKLAHTAIDLDQPLVDVITVDEEAKAYWDKFSEKEQAIITAPEKNYFGLATKKTEMIVKNYKKSEFRKLYGNT
ncbi:MAG: lyase family protein [Patescibacteria group bacterium]